MPATVLWMFTARAPLKNHIRSFLIGPAYRPAHIIDIQGAVHVSQAPSAQRGVEVIALHGFVREISTELAAENVAPLLGNPVDRDAGRGAIGPGAASGNGRLLDHHLVQDVAGVTRPLQVLDSHAVKVDFSSRLAMEIRGIGARSEEHTSEL